MAGNPELTAELKKMTRAELVEHCSAVLAQNGARPPVEYEPTRPCGECGRPLRRRPVGTPGAKPKYHRGCAEGRRLRLVREQRQRLRRQRKVGKRAKKKAIDDLVDVLRTGREEEHGCASVATRGMTLRSGGRSTRLTVTVPSSGAA